MSATAVNSITSATASSATSGDASLRLPSKALGQDDFLKLLVAQLSAQDPMNPQKDTEFIGQMAQFSSLEQAKAMQVDIAGLRTDQQVLQATSLIGRTVSIRTTGGETVSGLVSGLNLEGVTPRVVVNGLPYPVGDVLGITATNTVK